MFLVRANTFIPLLLIALELCYAGVAPKIQPFTFPNDYDSNNERKALCTVTRGDHPLQFQWEKDGHTISATNKIEIMLLEGASLSVLKIISASSSDSGNYTCVVSNAFGSSRHTAQLVVEAPPSWVVEPSDQNVLLGQSVRMNCTAAGLPKPKVKWYRTQNANVVEKTEDSPVVEINSVSETDEGQYICEASNGIGPGLRKTLTLSVRGKVHKHQVLEYGLQCPI